MRSLSQPPGLPHWTRCSRPHMFRLDQPSLFEDGQICTRINGTARRSLNLTKSTDRRLRKNHLFVDLGQLIVHRETHSDQAPPSPTHSCCTPSEDQSAVRVPPLSSLQNLGPRVQGSNTALHVLLKVLHRLKRLPRSLLDQHRVHVSIQPSRRVRISLSGVL